MKIVGNRFDDLCVVVIGRNEGERLRKCIDSVINTATLVVYVDSGSSDGSLDWAKSRGCEVVELDLRTPFTAARARNEGFFYAKKMNPNLSFTQFVDGDCEIVSGWMEKALIFLKANEDFAAVCGRRRERFPERTVYNKLCDLEWDTPVGEARSFGGDVMVRNSALSDVGCYRPTLIAGEEPELCVRLRKAGWKIMRLRCEMTLHDAAISRFAQWWRRTKRAGYAFAEGAAIHGSPPEKHYVREFHRAIFWGALLPALIVCGSLYDPRLFAASIAYPLQILRIAVRGDYKLPVAWWRAFFLVLGRFPEAAGSLSYLANSVLGRTGRLIEYK